MHITLLHCIRSDLPSHALDQYFLSYGPTKSLERPGLTAPLKEVLLKVHFPPRMHSYIYIALASAAWNTYASIKVEVRLYLLKQTDSVAFSTETKNNDYKY